MPSLIPHEFYQQYIQVPEDNLQKLLSSYTFLPFFQLYSYGFLRLLKHNLHHEEKSHAYLKILQSLQLLPESHL